MMNSMLARVRYGRHGIRSMVQEDGQQFKCSILIQPASFNLMAKLAT